MKTKFEKGGVGKKDFKSEARNEVTVVSAGTALSTKDRFENQTAKQYDSTKKKELEELQIARKLAAAKAQQQDTEEESVRDGVAEQENDRYRELEDFKKSAAAKQNLSKFESGAFSNVERSEIEARKEVETIHGSGIAASTLKRYETGDIERPEYESPVKQELGSINADTSTKKSLYEAGGGASREYESEAKKELESITSDAGEKRNKFESGELQSKQLKDEERDGELEQIRSASAAGGNKNKFESGELIKTEFDSDTKKELETMKTGASEAKSKYESGELIKTEFDSDVKKELETISSGAMDKKGKYERGELDQKDYDSGARAEADEVRKLTSSNSIKDKYKEAVVEGNKVVTSQPVTIEKAPPGEDPFPSRNDDEDFKITHHDIEQEDGDEESEAVYDDPAATSPDPITDPSADLNADPSSDPSDLDDDPSVNPSADSSADPSADYDDPIYDTPDDLSNENSEYVAPPEPKKMVNIEERFVKPAVEKPAPQVNKIVIPTFEKQVDSDEELNGETPDEEEAAKLKEQMWTKNTTDVKAMFEAKNQEDAANNETPKQIDLKAEINDDSD